MVGSLQLPKFGRKDFLEVNNCIACAEMLIRSLNTSLESTVSMSNFRVIQLNSLVLFLLLQNETKLSAQALASFKGNISRL